MGVEYEICDLSCRKKVKALIKPACAGGFLQNILHSHTNLFRYMESNMMSMPMRRYDQMLSVHAAAGGDTLPLTARKPNPSVSSVRGTTKRQTTGALSRGARWEEATHAPMEW